MPEDPEERSTSDRPEPSSSDAPAAWDRAEAEARAKALDEERPEPVLPEGTTVTEEHNCQPPRENTPEVGRTWSCPDCGKGWKLEPVEEAEAAPGGPAQQVAWSRVGGEPAP